MEGHAGRKGMTVTWAAGVAPSSASASSSNQPLATSAAGQLVDVAAQGSASAASAASEEDVLAQSGYTREDLEQLLADYEQEERRVSGTAEARSAAPSSASAVVEGGELPVADGEERVGLLRSSKARRCLRERD